MRKIILKALIFFIIPILSFSEELSTPDGGKYLIEKEKIIYKDKSGEERWQINLPGSDNIIKPSVLPNGNIIFISFFKSIKSFLKGTNYEFFVKFKPDIYFLICVQKENGKILWVLPIAYREEDNSNAVFFKGSAFISSGFYLMKINYEKGEIVKRYFIGNAVEKIKVENNYIKIIINEKNNLYYKFYDENKNENVPILFNYYLSYWHLYGTSNKIDEEFSYIYIYGPNVGFLYSKSIFASKKKKKEIDLTEHRNYYEKLISKDRTNPYFHFYLGQANFWLQNFDEAEKEFKESLNLSKEYPYFEAFRIGYFFEMMGMPEWADKFYNIGIKNIFKIRPFKPPFIINYEARTIFPPTFNIIPLFFFNGNIKRFKDLLEIKKAIFPSYIEGNLSFEKFYYKWLEKNGYYKEAKKEEERYRKDLKNPLSFIEHKFLSVFKFLGFHSSLICLFFSFIILSFSIFKISKKLIFGISLICIYILFYLLEQLDYYYNAVSFPNFVYIYLILMSFILFLLNIKKFYKVIIIAFLAIFSFLLYLENSFSFFKSEDLNFFLRNIFMFYILSLMVVFLYKFHKKIPTGIKYFSVISIFVFIVFYLLFSLFVIKIIEIPDGIHICFYRNFNFQGYFKNICEKKPKNTYGKFMLGLSYQMMENYDEALKYYEMAKNEEDTLNNMGVIYYEKGDIKKAEEYFLKASEKGNVASYYNLYLIKGDKKYFEIAKKLDEDWVLSFSKYSEGKFMLSSINPKKYYKLTFKWELPKWEYLNDFFQ